jgi:uncharacterized protein involved in exopolysaccharide biosynthesis
MKVQTTGRLLLHSLFRRRRIIVGLTLSIMGTILVGGLLWPPSYEASSSVVIRSRNYQNLLFPEPRGTGDATMFIKPQEEINTEIEIIRSRPVLSRVVEALQLHIPKQVLDAGLSGASRDLLRSGLSALRKSLAKLGLGQDPSEKNAFEAAVTRLGEQLRVEPAIDSQIIRIIYRDRDPVTASQVVNRVAEEYLHQHLAINLNREENTFYDEQINKLEGDLTGLQQELEQMKTTEGILSFSDHSKSLHKKLETFDLARATIQKEIISKRSKIRRIRDLRKTNPGLLIPLPEIAQDVQIQDLENKLINLQYTLVTLQQRYNDDSRQVEAAKDQLKQLRIQIREQVSRFLDREVAELRKLQAEEQALAEMMRQVKADMARLPAKEVALSNLEKQIADKQTVLTVLRNKHQDSVVTRATDFRLQNAKIVSQAPVPLKPAAPNLPLILVLGSILALVVGFSAALFVEYWDDSLKVPEDVELYLSRPVFASVPEL